MGNLLVATGHNSYAAAVSEADNRQEYAGTASAYMTTVLPTFTSAYA